jgi:copper chaperone CopZ
MKISKMFPALLIALFISSNLFGQNLKTEAFSVRGKCSMCKERIEAAVKSAGATSAYWDLKTQMLKVSYDPAKTNTDELEKKIASVGHDTEKYKADDKAYASLPDCCKYERGDNSTTKKPVASHSH